MSSVYTVLARKYRSQDFDSLIGQDVLVKTLTTAIEIDKIAHAFMFTGIRGTGKTSTARILAKALNCLSSDKATARPCNVCENCNAITAGQHIDVIELDAASHTGVDNMRDLLDAAQYKPTNGRYKVYIIDEVHMLSTSAFNAMLKTLEEAPPHIKFILATTEIRKVPITILSRCQRFDLARVGVDTLKKHFKMIADAEGVQLSDDANELIARASDGSVRDGLSLFDQAIAQTGGNVDRDAVLNMLKRADRGVVVDFMDILLSGDTAAAVKQGDELYESGMDMSMLLSDMMEWTHWATRLHPALKMGDAESAPFSANQRVRMQKTIVDVSLNTLSRIWQVMVASVEELQKSSNQKQAFDMLVVRLIHVADMPSVPAMLEHSPKLGVRSLELNKSETKSEPKTQPTAEDKQPQTPHSKLHTVDDLSAALTAAKEIILLSTLKNSIEISEMSDGHIKFFNRNGDKDFATNLGKWLHGYTGKQWKLEQIIESENIPTVNESVIADAKTDPLVADAMSLFAGAEVVK
ncbi:MAG: DNA polymerase III subunit gamma/tau [Alphaproteobacteria bacterium]|nr:DNA polymerase III subunit gamma/tau [Alphaproteobacteria bacterium]